MLKSEVIKYNDSAEIDKENLKVECYSSQAWALCQNKSKHINKVELRCAKLSKSYSWSGVVRFDN